MNDIYRYIVSPLWLDNQGTTPDTKNPFELVNLDSLEEQLKDTVRHLEKIQEFVKKVNVIQFMLREVLKVLILEWQGGS